MLGRGTGAGQTGRASACSNLLTDWRRAIFIQLMPCDKDAMEEIGEALHAVKDNTGVALRDAEELFKKRVELLLDTDCQVISEDAGMYAEEHLFPTAAQVAQIVVVGLNPSIAVTQLPSALGSGTTGPVVGASSSPGPCDRSKRY